jgi:putative transcriptional regulator
MRRASLLIAALLAALAALAAPVCAQPSGILLVARPGLVDPNFRETVLVVTRAQDGSTLGVILNRPTKERHGKFPQPLYAGGPVMQQVVVALFAADEPPKDAAFQVLPGVYLTMHPRTIDALLSRPRERLRLFSGFAGWAPRQLEAEMADGTWYALRATESALFRQDTSGLWRELVDQASGARTAKDAPTAIARR